MNIRCYATLAGGSILDNSFSLTTKKPWKVVKTLLIGGKVYVVIEHDYLESPETKSAFPEQQINFRIVKDDEMVDNNTGFTYINSHYLSSGSGQPHEFNMEIYHVLLQESQ